MNRSQSARTENAQCGAALPVALILLPVITLLALSATQIGRAGLRAAVNEELRVHSFVTAQSAVDGVIAEPANTPVTAGTGQVYCTPDAACEQPIVRLPPGLADALGPAGSLQVQVHRLEPELAPPPRGAGASLTRFYAAAFSVRAAHDATGSGYGRTEIDEGLILVLPHL